MHVNTQKTSRAWCEYVCARCRGDLQIALMLLRAFLPRIAHVFNCPHVGGLIAISPYTCVFWTFANIHVNTQKTSWAWCEYVYVCRRGDLQITHTEGFVSRL